MIFQESFKSGEGTQHSPIRGFQRYIFWSLRIKVLSQHSLLKQSVGSNITVLTINRKTVPAGQYFFYNSGIFRSPDKVSLTNGYILRLSLAFIQCDSLNSLVLPIEETVVIVRTMVFLKKKNCIILLTLLYSEWFLQQGNII